MRYPIIAGIAVGLFTSGCAFQEITREGAQVRLTQGEDSVKDCTFIGHVKGADHLNGGALGDGMARRNATYELQNKAASLGADMVHVSSTFTGMFGARLEGDAYKCGDHPSGQMASDGNPASTARMQEGIYSAPSGKYTVPVPVNPEMGGRRQETSLAVSFTDDLGQLFRIDDMPLSADEVAHLNQVGRNNYLEPFLAKVYLPSAILPAVPNATIGTIEELADIQGGAYYCEIYLPKGSTLTSSYYGGPLERTDTIRSALWFIRGHEVYVISLQQDLLSIFQQIHAKRHAENPNGQADPKYEEKRRSEMLKEATLKFVRSITFKEDIQPAVGTYEKPAVDRK